MEPAQPITLIGEEQKILKPIKEFKLLEKGKEYLITLGQSKFLDNLGISLKETSSEAKQYYVNFYTLEELQNLNKYFRIYDKINEVIPMFEEILNGKKVSLKFNINKAILNLKINQIGKGEELLSLELIMKTLTLEQICDNLSIEIKYLRNKVEEINELKNEIKLLKEENKKKDLIINELLEWKNILKGGNQMKNMIESKIIKKEEDLNIITNKLKKIESFKNMDISYKLIYRGSRDGGLPKNFHEKCDGIKNTVTIIKTVKGLKFGGYINYKWDSNKGWIDDDENCFIFSLDLMKIYNPIKGKKKYLFSGTCGPNFTEFGLKNNLFEKSSLNMHKKDMANKFFSDFTTDYEINGGENEFQVDEIEVFQVIPQ